MKNVKHIVLAATCVLLLTACVTAEDAGAAWKGRHIDTALAQFHNTPEVRISPSGAGSYVWENEWEEHFEEYTELKGKMEGDTFVGTSRVIPARTERHYRKFWLYTDAQGIIVDGGGSSTEGSWPFPDSYRGYLPRD
ncbi:hypothetical protein OT109_19365 [Phycisphaeraceae bacterium D3-23]